MTDIERIEEVKKILEEPSLLALSRRLGMSSAQVFYDIRSGKCGISKELILKIQRQIPTINQVWLLTGDGEILLSEKNVSQVGEVNSSPGGVVQNIANNGNVTVSGNGNENIGNTTTAAPSPDPSFAAVLKQLADTNQKQAAALADLIKTNAALVAALTKQHPTEQ